MNSMTLPCSQHLPSQPPSQELFPHDTSMTRSNPMLTNDHAYTYVFPDFPVVIASHSSFLPRSPRLPTLLGFLATLHTGQFPFLFCWLFPSCSVNASSLSASISQLLCFPECMVSTQTMAVECRKKGATERVGKEGWRANPGRNQSTRYNCMKTDT